MTPLRSRAPVRYGMAVAAVLFVLCVKFSLSALTGTEFAFTLFLAAVLVSAWFGGLGPAVLATVLAALLGDYYFLPPVGSVLSGDQREMNRLIQFVIEGLFISVVSGTRSRVLALLHRRVEELHV